jgi:hypothetical protein
MPQRSSGRASLLSVALLAGCIAGCGKEIARIPMHGEDSAATSVTVQQGTKLGLWTSLDADFNGEFVARYEIELYESGQLTGKTTCDPLDVSTKIGARELNLNGQRSVSWQGKMRCELVAKSKGTLHLRAKLVFVKKPASLTIRDISLVVKQ